MSSKQIEDLFGKINEGKPESGSQQLGNLNVEDALNPDFDKKIEASVKLLNDNKDKWKIVEGDSIVGPAKIIVVTDKSNDPTTQGVNDAAKALNSRPGVQPDVAARIKKHNEKKQASRGRREVPTFPLSGGSLEGEFHAIFNTHDIEKSVIEMTGGAIGGFSPALDKNSSSRADSFEAIMKAIYKQLANIGKSLTESDQETLNDAIKNLRKYEKQAYVNAEALNQYLSLHEKYKRSDNEEIKSALKDMTVQEFIGLYNKNMKKADRKSRRIYLVVNNLLAQLGN